MFRQLQGPGLGEEQPINFRTSDDDETNEILLFDVFEIVRRGAPHQDAPGGERAGGADFRYIYCGGDCKVAEYLRRLEIGIENKAYSCFVFALVQQGLDTETANKINARCYTRYLTVKHIRQIIDEYGLNLQLTVWHDSKHNKVFIKADPKKKPAYKVAVYLNHYFVDETTPFTERDIGLNWGYAEPRQLTSMRLICALMSSNQFRAMKIGELPKEIEQQTINDLSYNPKYCLSNDEQRKPITLDEVLQDPEAKKAPSYGMYLLHQKVLNRKDIYAVSGVVKHFISKCVHGGRMF
jgi:hypothetical protein